jgi:K+-transporting ATPase ATPase C chain
VTIVRQLRAALALTLILSVVTGLAYPALVTMTSRLLFPWQASGSLVRANGRVVGSDLIGQPFAQPWYFHPRPSAAGAGYDGTASGGTNRGPTSAALAAAVAARADTLVASGSAARGAVPGDAVTASASGLDPHVSPANARLQVARVASARGADSATVRALLERHIEGRQLGVLGEPRVNVLRLNIALDAAFPLPATTPRADSTTHPESP